MKSLAIAACLLAGGLVSASESEAGGGNLDLVSVMFDKTGRYVEKFIGDATISKSGRQYILANPKVLRGREMTTLEAQKRFRGPMSVRVDGDLLYVPDFGSHRIQPFHCDRRLRSIVIRRSQRRMHRHAQRAMVIGRRAVMMRGLLQRGKLGVRMRDLRRAHQADRHHTH